MATIKFFLHDKNKKKTSIIAVISMKRQYKIRTGISVPVKYWNISTGKCREVREFQEACHINAQLEEWEILLKNIARDYEARLITPEQSEFNEAVERALKIRSGYTDGDKTPYLSD
ncbi:MAG: hypothetical protein LBG31_06395, partial [Prevotellaceae bacterium]|nr:hypothetical protein [Prevotellaceae bacterium]